MGSKKGTFLTIVSALVALIVALATIQSTQASIDYWLQMPETFTPGLNQVTAYCRNGGGMDGDFNLVVTFENATFSSETELPYTQMNNSTVKLKFVLHREEAKEKTLKFILEEKASFSISLRLETLNFIQFVKANALFPTQLSYRWNETSQEYVCSSTQ